MKNAILNLNFFPPHTRHALLVVALKLYTNYDAKVMKGTCGAYIKVILFSGLLHTLKLFWKTPRENGDLHFARNSKTIWCSLILKIVYYSTKM